MSEDSAAPSSTEPGIVGEIVGEFHKLEEKVEHLIHHQTETVPNVTPGSPAIEGSTTLLDVSGQPIMSLDSAKLSEPLLTETSVLASATVSGEPSTSIQTSSAGSEAPNVLPASTSGTPADSMPSPVVQDAPAPDVTAINSPTVELGNVAAVETASSLSESSTLSALTLPETSTASSESAEVGNAVASVETASVTTSDATLGASSASPSIDGDLPNAAPAVVEQPVIAASALDASGSDTQAVEPSVHESLLRKIIGVIERDFNMFSGELKQLMTEAKTHL